MANNIAYGYSGICLAAVLFGICYAPVKKVPMGDGMFFQWLMCSAIALVGIGVQLVVGNSQFYPLGLLGGALWATGNVCAVPVFKTIGMSLGILIWSMVNMLVGWASGRFGWFGIHPMIPSDPIMNYVGVAIAMSTTIVYGFVRPTINPVDDVIQINSATLESGSSGDEESTPLLNSSGSASLSRYVNMANWNPMVRRAVGILLSIFSGVNYGLTFAPSIYIQDNYPGASKRGLDYVLANYLGAFLAASFYFVVYALLKRGRNLVPSSQMILPSLLSGILWALANVGWFIANEQLSEAISFPIITTIPCIIASAIGIFIFKEITGKYNFILLGGAFVLTVVGVTLTALSK